MVVEVAESSLERDRQKRRVYARAAIPVYWIVNLVDRQIEVHTQRVAEQQEPDYGQQSVYQVGESVPLQLDGQPVGDIPVVDLLP